MLNLFQHLPDETVRAYSRGKETLKRVQGDSVGNSRDTAINAV